MEEKKSIKSFIKRHGAEIALGASCVACAVVGYKVGVKQTTAKFMKDLCENSGGQLLEELKEEVCDIVTDAIEDSIL